jgi:hypothetical protein
VIAFQEATMIVFLLSCILSLERWSHFNFLPLERQKAKNLQKKLKNCLLKISVVMLFLFHFPSSQHLFFSLFLKIKEH